MIFTDDDLKWLLFRVVQALFLEHDAKCEALETLSPQAHYKIGCSICDLINEGWKAADHEVGFELTKEKSDEMFAHIQGRLHDIHNHSERYSQCWCYEAWRKAAILDVAREAYEDAAKIADEVGIDSEEGREIARRIRAKAKELNKKEN